MRHIINEIRFDFRNLTLTNQLTQSARISNNDNECKNYRQNSNTH